MPRLPVGLVRWHMITTCMGGCGEQDLNGDDVDPIAAEAEEASTEEGEGDGGIADGTSGILALILELLHLAWHHCGKGWDCASYTDVIRCWVTVSRMVNMGETNRCMKWSHMNADPPEWGRGGNGEDLTCTDVYADGESEADVGG